jgi:hypothetical protein
MDEDDELTIVVTAAPGASALERDGMLHRLEEAVAVAVSEVALEGYVTNGVTDPAEVRLVIAAADLASPEILSLVGDSVSELLADPDLAGWGPYSVNVTDEVRDEENSDAEIMWDVLPDGEVEDTETLPVDEFDLQAARLRLEQDAEHLSGAMNLAWLTALDTGEPAVAEELEEDDDSGDVEETDELEETDDSAEALDDEESETAEESAEDAEEAEGDDGIEAAEGEADASDESGPSDESEPSDADEALEDDEDAHLDPHAAAVAEAKYAAGALFQASVVVLDHLFMDLQTLAVEHHGASVADLDDAAFFVLHELPSRYAHRYDALFVQEFIVATVDVTRRFTAGWEPLACVAQELALRMILNGAEFQLELAEVKLSDGWRAEIEDALFEDLDHEMLFDASLDGIEDDSEQLAELRSAPLAFADWFTPFNAERHLPPYLLDDPDAEPEADAEPEFEADPEAEAEPEE